MSKHTKGPWRSLPPQGSDASFEILDNQEMLKGRKARLVTRIATVHFTDMGRDEETANANANLIAAAPDMLELLEILADPDNPINADLLKVDEMIRLAIAAAKGDKV